MRSYAATAILLSCLAVGCTSISLSGVKREMVVTPFEKATFVPVNPALPEGPQIAVLWGDPSSESSAMLMKLKNGAIPLHTHSSDYHLVVLQGTMKHWGKGETEAEAAPLGQGSYWFQPGDMVHGGACLTDECLMHIVWSGKRDAKPAPAETSE